MKRHDHSKGLAAWLIAATLLALGGPALATEVYTWTDEQGVVHFSDAPRASGEVQTIETGEAPPVIEPSPPDAPAADDTPANADSRPEEAPPSAAQARREAMQKRGAEQREAREENERLCARHRQRLQQLEPSRRVFYRNEAGEEVRMDDEERVALVEEDRAFLAENCD